MPGELCGATLLGNMWPDENVCTEGNHHQMRDMIQARGDQRDRERRAVLAAQVDAGLLKVVK